LHGYAHRVLNFLIILYNLNVKTFKRDIKK